MGRERREARDGGSSTQQPLLVQGREYTPDRYNSVKCTQEVDTTNLSSDTSEKIELEPEEGEKSVGLKAEMTLLNGCTVNRAMLAGV